MIVGRVWPYPIPDPVPYFPKGGVPHTQPGLRSADRCTDRQRSDAVLRLGGPQAARLLNCSPGADSHKDQHHRR